MQQETQPAGLPFIEEQRTPPTSRKAQRLAARRRRQTIAVSIITVVLAVAAIPLLMILLNAAFLPTWLAYIPLIAVGGFFGIFGAWRGRKSAENLTPTNRPSIFRPSRKPSPEVSEKDVLKLLDSIIDSNWLMYRHLPVPDSSDTIDIVLVGSTGVYTLDINNDSGNFRLREGLWEWQDWHSRWRVDPKNPLARLRHKRDALDEYLQSKYLDGNLQSRLIWAGKGHIELPNGNDDVWFLDDGGDWIWQDLNRGKLITRDTMDDICWVFDQLADVGPTNYSN